MLDSSFAKLVKIVKGADAKRKVESVQRLSHCESVMAWQSGVKKKCHCEPVRAWQSISENLKIIIKEITGLLRHFVSHNDEKSFGQLRLVRNAEKLRKKIAFTLAEVLITIAIVGVVAVMTLPNLIQKNQERITVNKVKQTYAIMTQAIKLAEVDYGPLPTWEIRYYTNTNITNIFGLIKPHLKIAYECGLYDAEEKCIHNGKFKELNANDESTSYSSNPHYYKFMLANGVSVWIRGALTANNFIAVFIDVNGPKPPNTVGKDLFSFVYHVNALVPNGMTGTESSDPSLSCSLKTTSNGFGCAYYIISKKNMNYLHEK